MTAAKNVGMWHRRVERGAGALITPGDVRTFANPTCGTSARLVDLYRSYVCEFALFSSRDIQQVGPVWYLLLFLLLGNKRLAMLLSVSFYVIPLYGVIAVPLSLLLHFSPLCGAFVVLVLVFLHGFSCASYMVAFFRGLVII